MEHGSFDVLGLTPAEKKSFQATFDKLQEVFNLQIEKKFNFNFNAFNIFKTYEDYYIRDAFKIIDPASYSHLTFTEVWYSFAGGRSGQISGNEHQIWGIGYLKNNYGNILVQPETLFLKIQELIEPLEIDFTEDKKFSKRFYLLSTNKELAVKFFKPNVRDLFLGLESNDFYIEIKGRILIIGNKKTVSPKKGIEIANFVRTISSMGL